MNHVRSLFVGLALAVPFYLLLIDTLSTPELIAGGCAVMLSAGALKLAHAQGAGGAAYRARWLRFGWRAVLAIPRQILIVCAEIISQALEPRPTRGCLRAASFGAQRDEAGDRGRTVLAEAVGTIPPNTIVIGVDTAAGVLLVHQLRRDGGSEQLDPLRLGSAGSER